MNGIANTFLSSLVKKRSENFAIPRNCEIFFIVLVSKFTA